MTMVHDNLPDGWERCRFGDIAQSRMGKTILAKHLTDTGIPVYSAGQDNEPWGFILESDTQFGDCTIVVSARGSIGFPKLPIHTPFVSTQTTIAATCDSRATAEFAYHFLKSCDWSALQAGGAIPMLTVKRLNDIELNYPPAAEQRRIVSRIDALQARSRKARECLAEIGPLLSQFRQSLLSAAFRGDLTADWRAANPNTEPATELLARIRQDRRRKWEEAELAKYEAKGKKPPRGWKDRYGELNKKAVRATVAEFRADTLAINEVPENWELIRLGEIACLQAGYAFKSEWFSKTGVRLLRGTNIEPGSTRWTDTVYLPGKECHRYAGYLLNEGDVVIAMDRPVIAAGPAHTKCLI